MSALLRQLTLIIGILLFGVTSVTPCAEGNGSSHENVASPLVATASHTCVISPCQRVRAPSLVNTKNESSDLKPKLAPTTDGLLVSVPLAIRQRPAHATAFFRQIESSNAASLATLRTIVLRT